MGYEIAIKVCGMRDGENIRAAEALGLQWMGFICWNGSARCVTATPTYLPETCRRVGVFVRSEEHTSELQSP